MLAGTCSVPSSCGVMLPTVMIAPPPATVSLASRGVSSALSTQIRQLEDQFGQPLFERRQRQLRLTEAGQLALSYAESIFSAGHELLALLREGQGPGRQVLRIGAVATLSRNFQDNLLRPLVRRDDVELLLQSGSLDELLGRLQVHTLDLVLANQAVDGTGDAP